MYIPPLRTTNWDWPDKRTSRTTTPEFIHYLLTSLGLAISHIYQLCRTVVTRSRILTEPYARDIVRNKEGPASIGRC